MMKDPPLDQPDPIEIPAERVSEAIRRGLESVPDHLAMLGHIVDTLPPAVGDQDKDWVSEKLLVVTEVLDELVLFLGLSGQHLGDETGIMLRDRLVDFIGRLEQAMIRGGHESVMTVLRTALPGAIADLKSWADTLSRYEVT